MIGKIRDISHTVSMGLVYEHLHVFFVDVDGCL